MRLRLRENQYRRCSRRRRPSGRRFARRRAPAFRRCSLRETPRRATPHEPSPRAVAWSKNDGLPAPSSPPVRLYAPWSKAPRQRRRAADGDKLHRNDACLQFASKQCLSIISSAPPRVQRNVGLDTREPCSRDPGRRAFSTPDLPAKIDNGIHSSDVSPPFGRNW